MDNIPVTYYHTSPTSSPVSSLAYSRSQVQRSVVDDSSLVQEQLLRLIALKREENETLSKALAESVSRSEYEFVLAKLERAESLLKEKEERIASLMPLLNNGRPQQQSDSRIESPSKGIVIAVEERQVQMLGRRFRELSADYAELDDRYSALRQEHEKTLQALLSKETEIEKLKARHAAAISDVQFKHQQEMYILQDRKQSTEINKPKTTVKQSSSSTTDRPSKSSIPVPKPIRSVPNRRR